MASVPKSVASAVPPAASTTVTVLDKPQLSSYAAQTAPNSQVPYVPGNEGFSPQAIASQPVYGQAAANAMIPDGGGHGSPTVPAEGFLFRRGPADAHYMSEREPVSPYAKVNNPPTRGMGTRIQPFQNHTAQSQNTDNAGWKQSGMQQRTSVMRNTLPPDGMGYAPQTYQPGQLPQRANVQRFLPVTGSDPYGSGVLATGGAGQTAGGIGGAQYTAAPGPPATSPATGTGTGTGMPVWG
jgi:hypothetical protein